MKLSFLLSIMLFGVGTGCAAERLNPAMLSKDSLESSLFVRFIPKSFLATLERNEIGQQSFGRYVAGEWYHETPADTSRQRFLIYCDDWGGHVLLRLIGFEHGDWNVLAETDSVNGEWELGIRLEDVDCDGTNEIILEYVSGAWGYSGMEVVKYAQGKLTLLTPTGRRSNGPRGRTVDLRKDSTGCSWRIEVTLDGPIKYEPDRMETFRLDPVQKTFKMVSEEKWPRRQEEKK